MRNSVTPYATRAPPIYQPATGSNIAARFTLRGVRLRGLGGLAVGTACRASIRAVGGRSLALLACRLVVVLVVMAGPFKRVACCQDPHRRKPHLCAICEGAGTG